MDEVELKTLDLLEKTHWWYKVRKLILTKILVDQVKKDGNILDLGSATGGNTILMRNLGFEVTSVEYSEFGVNVQRNKGIQAVHADACDLPFNDGSFDSVVCLDVLEHIQNDIEAIAEIHRVLKFGGLAVISVPEDMRLWSNHDIFVNHVRRYSRKELISKLYSAGFEILDVYSVNRFLKPLLRIKRRFIKSSDLKELNYIVNSILYHFAKLDFSTRYIGGSGVTIWLIARKI